MIDLTNLNDKQKEAVLATEGPLLVLAGAGSGKTKVLTTRIAYLIEEKNISPFHILAITFTNKAAKEMQERLINLIGEVARNIQVSTFHSFGLKLLRENYELLGYDRNFVIMDSDDSLTVIKRILKELDLDLLKNVTGDLFKIYFSDIDTLLKISKNSNILSKYFKYIWILCKETFDFTGIHV